MLDEEGLGQRWQVINAGVGSYSILEYLYLVNGGLALQPDLVILNYDLSDVFDDIQYTALARLDGQGRPVAVTPEPEPPQGGLVSKFLRSLKEFLKRNTRIYNFVRLRIDRAVEAARHKGMATGDIRRDKYAMLRPTYQPTDDRDWALSYRYILLIRDTLRERGIDFWVTVFPYGLQVSPREWEQGRLLWGFERGLVYSTRPQEFVEQFCKRNGIPVINMCPAFKELARTNLSHLPRIQWPLAPSGSPAGCTRVAVCAPSLHPREGERRFRE